MHYLNYEFFEAFKSLDKLCKEVYENSVENKLGVTLYLEDMENNAHLVATSVSSWHSDYKRLKSLRNIRNEFAHSPDSFSMDICTQEDIDYINDFKKRILNQTDPIALLRKQEEKINCTDKKEKSGMQSEIDGNDMNKECAGCFLLIPFLIVVGLLIAIFVIFS